MDKIIRIGVMVVGDKMKVYGATEYWENGMLECVYDGFGEEKDGVIIWEEGYNPPKNDDFHFTTIIRFNGDISGQIFKKASDRIKRMQDMECKEL